LAQGCPPFCLTATLLSWARRLLAAARATLARQTRRQAAGAEASGVVRAGTASRSATIAQGLDVDGAEWLMGRLEVRPRSETGSIADSAWCSSPRELGLEAELIVKGVTGVTAHKAMLARSVAEEPTTTINERLGVHHEGLWQAAGAIKSELDPEFKGQLRDLNSAYGILRHIDAAWCATLRTHVHSAMDHMGVAAVVANGSARSLECVPAECEDLEPDGLDLWLADAVVATTVGTTDGEVSLLEAETVEVGDNEVVNEAITDSVDIAKMAAIDDIEFAKMAVPKRAPWADESVDDDCVGVAVAAGPRGLGLDPHGGADGAPDDGGDDVAEKPAAEEAAAEQAAAEKAEAEKTAPEKSAAEAAHEMLDSLAPSLVDIARGFGETCAAGAALPFRPAFANVDDKIAALKVLLRYEASPDAIADWSEQLRHCEGLQAAGT